MCKTLDIYKGIYKTHQGLKRSLDKLGIDHSNGEITIDDYKRLLNRRFISGDKAVKKEIRKRLDELEFGLEKYKLEVSPKLEDSKPPVYKKVVIQVMDFWETFADLIVSRGIAFFSLFVVILFQIHHVANVIMGAGVLDAWYTLRKSLIPSSF